MAKVEFKKGLKANLPNSADDNVLLFTNDTGELYKGQGTGQPLLKYSDVIYKTTLPVSGLEEKVYLVESGVGSLKLYAYRNGTWIDFSSGGQGVDTNILNMLLGLESKTDTFGYDDNENIISVDTVYVNPNLNDENTTYTYDNNENITKEETTKQGKKIINTFSYDANDNIIGVNTVVTNI